MFFFPDPRPFQERNSPADESVRLCWLKPQESLSIGLVNQVENFESAFPVACIRPLAVTRENVPSGCELQWMREGSRSEKTGSSHNRMTRLLIHFPLFVPLAKGDSPVFPFPSAAIWMCVYYGPVRFDPLASGHIRRKRNFWGRNRQ